MKRLFKNSKHKESSSSSLTDQLEIAERSSNSLDYKQKNKDKIKKYEYANKTHNSSAHSLPMNLPYPTQKVQLDQTKKTSKNFSEDESSSITSGSGLCQNQTQHTSNNSNNTISVILNEDSLASPFKKTKSVNANSTQNSINSQSNNVPNATNPTSILTNEVTLNKLVFKEDLEPIFEEIKLRKEREQKLSVNLEVLKNQYEADFAIYNQNLQEEKERHDRLEEQMNDLIELHQNEVENLKQIIGDMEEKVQYQSEERLRDINELLESCLTRISRMEHQQYQQLQQLVTLDSLEISHPRRIFLKFINIIFIIILLLVTAITAIISLFVKTRLRFLATITFSIIFYFFLNQKQEILFYLSKRIDKNYLVFLNFFTMNGPTRNYSEMN